MVSMSLERVLSLVGDFFEIYVCFNIGLVSLECKVSGRFKDQRAIVVEDVCNGRGCEVEDAKPSPVIGRFFGGLNVA